MKTDLEIQQDVMAELKWEAKINAVKPAEIGVAVKNGIVTLTGNVESYFKKLAAEKAAMRVAGVKVIVNNVEVKVSSIFNKSDTDIAEAILNKIKWSTTIPQDSIKIKVEDGWVTLEGNVTWEYQKISARSAIEDLRGVRGVTNNIKVISKTPTKQEVKEKIKEAIQRSATKDAEKINVVLTGDKITLTGSVRSFAEKKDAEYAAWSAPGVTDVDNKIEVSFSEIYA